MLLLLAWLGCASPALLPPAVAAPFAGAHDKPADVYGMTPQFSASGLTWFVLREGDGLVAMPGQTVEVHYVGFVSTGEKFDASYDRNEVFSFRLGAGRVIKGWDEGVAGMKVGEQRQLRIPSKLGYGSRGAGGLIPPNTDLIFDVELVGVK
jgi:FKBP-type peptidyl-prolyl cis-trans isomerase